MTHNTKSYLELLSRRGSRRRTRKGRRTRKRKQRRWRIKLRKKKKKKKKGKIEEEEAAVAAQQVADVEEDEEGSEAFPIDLRKMCLLPAACSPETAENDSDIEIIDLLGEEGVDYVEEDRKWKWWK